MMKWTAEQTEKSPSLINHLRLKIPLAPVSYLRQLIRSGKIRINGKEADADQAIQPGNVITLPESRKLIEFVREGKKLPTILYESKQILIIRKPAGIATHTSQGHEDDNLTARVKTLLFSRGDTFRSAPVHRLDLPTSGPVIFGKGQKAISELGKLMQEGRINKCYLALTASGLPDSGLLDGTVPGKGKEKPAQTGYRTLEVQDNLALLELELRTGRQHQIRRQLADAGYPVVGDDRYGGPQLPSLDRLFLHCHHLGFPCPFSGQQISIIEPLPATLQDFLINTGFRLSKLPPARGKNS